MKKEFINQQLFSATIKASFGRNKIYKPKAKKLNFRVSLMEYLNSILSFYKSPVEEKDHLVQIQKLSDFSSSFPILGINFQSLEVNLMKVQIYFVLQNINNILNNIIIF